MEPRASWSLGILFGFLILVRCESKAPPAQFVFGDSLVDQGNNNNLRSLAKADFEPYGIDFAQGDFLPTGRFSNGRIITDLISQELGAEPVLAYLDTNAHGTNLLRGCSFASAGAGILDDTGAIFIQLLTMPEQLQYFANVKKEITSLLGQAAADELISSALYSITIGGNDYINNYANIGSRRARQFPDYNDYNHLLITTFREQLRELYRLGARKVVISNVAPLGCIPSQLSQKSKDGTCVKIMNDYAFSYNALLPPMVFGLEKELPGAKFVIGDIYGLVIEHINNPQKYGFTSVNTACCGLGRFNGILPCNQLSRVCPNREEYLFWDPYHATDRFNVLVVQRLLFGPPSDIFPININQLLAL